LQRFFVAAKNPHMKHPFLALAPLAMACLTFGCGNSGAQNEPTNAPTAKATPDSSKPSASSGKWEKLVMLPFRDAQGTVVVEMPFPADWKLNANRKPGEPTIEGGNGVKVTDYPLQMFSYNSDPRVQQSYQMAGKTMRPLPDLERLVQEDLVPWAEKRGLKFERQYEVPEVSAMDKWYNDQLFKAMPSQMKITAIGSDWTTESGEKCFILMHLNSSFGQNLQIWSYYCSTLQADKAHYETARKQLIFGLANARYNLQPIAAYNQMEAQKAGQSWAAHNQRMAQNQANFEASQRAFVNRSTAAHDALMAGWNARNAASDKNQERFVDTINERTKVIDPSSGNAYKVESGYNHYWMNADGKYISTDKQDYDPNQDKALNNQKWEELKKTDY